ncbi:MAG: dihydroneopterin aldolase, partial [Salinivirgaceae bacterium]
MAQTYNNNYPKKNTIMGIIELENMEFFAYHGCYEQEQVVGNRFLVDLTLHTNCEKPQQTDNIEDALNYLKVYEL